MIRNRLARFIPVALMIATATIYMPSLGEFARASGFWFLLPIWVCLLVGAVTILLWIEDRIGKSRTASPTVHNTNFFKPSISAFGWSDRLKVSEESIEEAFETSKGRQDGVIGAVDERGNELVLRWSRKGWEIKLLPEDERVKKIAVGDKSRWVGKEVEVKNWFGILKRFPNDWHDDQTAKCVVTAFLGSSEMPSQIDWATVRYT